MGQIIKVTVYTVAAMGIVAIFVATCAVFSAYIIPRIKRVSRGEAAPSTTIECCPAGLGCNDPSSQARRCLRAEARRIAKTNELIRFEQAWSDFCAVPKRKKRERAQAKAEYDTARDEIIARALREASEHIDAARTAQLPGHLQLGVGGDVVEEAPRTRSPF